VSGTLHRVQETWRPRRPKVPDTFFMHLLDSRRLEVRQTSRCGNAAKALLIDADPGMMTTEG